MTATRWNVRVLAGVLIALGSCVAIAGAWGLGTVLVFASILAALWSNEIARREALERVLEELRTGRVAVIHTLRTQRGGKAS